MVVPARRLATYSDLARTPEGVHVEIIAGEIYSFRAAFPGTAALASD